jgi:Protein of unknown function (DUF3987)/Primase C terminal 2 (PriCT-2)/Bifunctional DNA primase/polymerase, N-terminal
VNTPLQIATPDELNALRFQLRNNAYHPVPVIGAHVNTNSAGKRPIMEAWQTRCFNADEQEIARWPQAERNSTNTGILCGKTVGVDIDVLDPELSDYLVRRCKAHLGPTSLLRIGREPKTLLCYRVESPVKKLQTPDLFFNDGVDGVKAKVEILGAGQQFVAFGIHPDTHAPYRWPERSPLDTPATDIPLVTLEALQVFVAEAEQVLRGAGARTGSEIKRAGQAQTTGPITRPGKITSAFRDNELPSRETISDALDHIPNDMDYDGWIRIGFSLYHGLGDGGRDLWERWSDRSSKNDPSLTARKWPTFASGASITIRTVLWEAGRNGWKQSREGDAASRGDNAVTGERSEKIAVAWNDPVELPSSLRPVASFDFEFLPRNIAPWVRDISDRMQCPADFVAVSAVTALGSALGRKIGIRPQQQTNWLEVPNLWACIVGRPGAMKSPAMAEALKPLQRLEAEARKANETALRDFAADKEAFELRKQHTQKKAKSALERGEEISKMLRIDEPQAPKSRRFIVNDCTYEALGEILADNPTGILASRDELISLLKTLDREEYAAARGFFLTAWNGTSGYTFDRIMRGRTHIEAACVSLLGSTQPGKIAEYMRRAVSGGAGDDGLIQRFGLLVWPDQSTDWKDVDRYPDSNARQLAWDTFQRMADLTPASVGAEMDQFEAIPFLRFDESGQILFSQWRETLERRLRFGELHAAMESHLSKYRKLVPALALINHLADGGVGPVDELAALRAVSFSEYLESHARRAYAAGSEAEAAAAKAILNRIRAGDLSSGFTARDIRQRDWSNLTDKDQIQAGLGLLVDCDWIAADRIDTGGRPKTSYRINPRAAQ